jgi:hypothetical protein
MKDLTPLPLYMTVSRAVRKIEGENNGSDE